MPIHRTLKKDFFKNWNEEMAYVLGFFAADGSMLRNNRGAHFIEFQITDEQILKDIKKMIGSNHKITARNRDIKWKTSYRLQIGSKEWFGDLQKLGFMQAKSLVLKFPNIPRLYQSAFIRGYFDGDGGVYFKSHKAKDRKNPRWVFSTHFTSGSRLFLENLHSLLKEHGIQKGFIVTKAKDKGFDLIFSHHDSIALYWFMYNNAPRICLKRKYRVFNKALTTLYGETMRL